MTNSPQIEVSSTKPNKILLGFSGVLFIAALAIFYGLNTQDLWVRVLSLVVLMVAAAVVFFISETGKQLIEYARASLRESRKVVWPTTNEALQMTAYVFGFVFLMATFLWIIDKILEWALYDLILGWIR